MQYVAFLLCYCYAECRYAECHYAECHYAECRYAEYHYAECHYAECHYAQYRYAECHYTECRGTMGCLSERANALFAKRLSTKCRLTKRRGAPQLGSH